VSLLLDTHIVLWWLSDDSRLPTDLAERLDHDPDIYLSPVTVWEVAVKHSIGKLAGPDNLPELVRDSGFIEVPLNHRHAIEAARLPLLHRDPFDRMLVAQARCESFTLVTADPWCQKYEVALYPV
jgi:PIN domain nuclease of toxin-antitoxin system